MAEDCCTPSCNIMNLACSGGSNVGQLANQAAVELTQENFGKGNPEPGPGLRSRRSSCRLIKIKRISNAEYRISKCSTAALGCDPSGLAGIYLLRRCLEAAMSV